MQSSLKVLMMGAALALALPLGAQAQYRHDERHPHYVRAMAEVSAAYILLKHARGDPPARPEEERAMVDIEYAFSTLQNASDVSVRSGDADDVAPPQDHNVYDHRTRLHRALDLLHDAYDQTNRGEEDPDARGPKHRALDMIDAAIHSTEEAIRIANY
jgi:hypothetical protein